MNMVNSPLDRVSRQTSASVGSAPPWAIVTPESYATRVPAGGQRNSCAPAKGRNCIAAGVGTLVTGVAPPLAVSVWHAASKTALAAKTIIRAFLMAPPSFPR